MIKDAIEYIIGMAKPSFNVVDGVTLTNKKLNEILPHIPNAPLHLSSLTGLIAYLINCGGMDQFSMTSAFVQVCSATDVRAISSLDQYGRRWTLATAEFESNLLRAFPIGEYMGLDTMIVNIKRHFEITDQTVALLDLISHISADHSEKISDNGITQEIVTKRGISFKSEETPQFFQLSMRRTFAELGPMESKFFVRFKENGNNVTATLSEATFDKWEHAAKLAIQDLLVNELPGWVVMV
jgi:hypothetical protein